MQGGVVIVGASHGGVQAAASLREEGFDGPVTLVGDEAELPYHRPPLSKTFIKEENPQPQLLRGEPFYTGNDITLRLGARVTRIDRYGSRLELGDGSEIPFDRVILATGSRPRMLAVSGEPLAGVVSLRSLSDARRIRDLASRTEDIVILGGGFIGLEIGATLASGGRRVTVLEALPRLLGRAVAPDVAAHVSARLATLGIRVLTSTTLDRLEGDAGHLTHALISAGERIPAGMLVVGIGAIPNIKLADEFGLTCDNGIRVDGGMRTSAPEILAVGDAVSYRHWFAGSEVRLESVQNATDQARTAARTIVGRDEDYSAVPWFWSDIGDMKLQMVGLASTGDRHVLVGDAAGGAFSVYHYLGERMISIDSVNRPADHMLGRRMVAAGYSPSQADLAAGPEAIKAAFQAAQAKP